MATSPTPITLTINVEAYHLVVDPRRTLLDTLREDLDLPGTKRVCGMGNCGACTVEVDGRTMYSCLLLAIDCQDRDITTIEGVAHGEELDPVQEAFIECDAFQCGFCTSGQIMSMRNLLRRVPEPTEDEIRVAMSGNLCRCGAYMNIIRAGKRAAELQAARAGKAATS